MKKQFYFFRKIAVLFVFLAFYGCQTKDGKPTDAALTDSVPPIDRSVALKPPMGWNSWDSFGWTVNEEQVRANAQYMAKNLKHSGYEYIIVDQMWYGDEEASDFEAFVHETIPTKPNYSINEYGVLQPDTVKFPSARGGKGFKPLADYIHSLGLKIGIHRIRGTPGKPVSMGVATGWGKEPILVRKDIRGFITNRLMYAMYREAFHLVENGYATTEDVNRACRNDGGHWMTFCGLFRYMDIAGLQAYYAVMKDLFPTLSNQTDVPKLIEGIARQGGNGITNGKGFYDYTPAEAAE